MLHRNGRRGLVAPGWASARELFANVTAERDSLRRELFEVRRDRDRLFEALHEFKAEVRALRSRAEQRVVELHRLRDMERARAAERDDSTPLH